MNNSNKITYTPEDITNAKMKAVEWLRLFSFGIYVYTIDDKVVDKLFLGNSYHTTLKKLLKEEFPTYNYCYLKDNTLTIFSNTDKLELNISYDIV